MPEIWNILQPKNASVTRDIDAEIRDVLEQLATLALSWETPGTSLPYLTLTSGRVVVKPLNAEAIELAQCAHLIYQRL